MQHKVIGKGVYRQKDTKSSNGNALSKGNFRMKEVFKRTSLGKTSAKSKMV